MNGDVTVREVMRREYVSASEGDSIQDTASLMLDEGVAAVVVLRGRDPVGILTQRDVLAAAVGDAGLESLTVSDAMQGNPSTISPDASLTAATDRMSGTAARRLLVAEEGEPLGVISEHDIVMASTLSTGMEGQSSPDHEAETGGMTTEAVTATAAGTAADDEYSNQGICEVCGSLRRDLSSFNGQLVCSDCKDV
jgi:CBS domain-containing protein